MSVLVTGHTGFKGSWLSLWLEMLGADVHGYALEPPTSPSLYEVAQVAEAVASDTRSDVCDLDAVSACVERTRAQLVFHLAAQPLVLEGYRDPVRTFQTNVVGTMNVLEAVRQSETVKAVVVVTTDKVYENREWDYPYREIDPLGGADPYSASKAAAELVANAYRSSFFDSRLPTATRIATARAGNVIGGGDWGADRLVPDCVRAFLSGEPVKLKNPGSVRPWQHVLDCLAGYICLAQRLMEVSSGQEYAGPWNFSPPVTDDATVGVVATGCAARWGDGARIEQDTQPSEHHEASLLRLDSSEARRRLGWSSRWTFDDALDRTIAWYRRWSRGEDMRAFTRDQIRSYEEGQR
jgi:CDP-glucose 4,6-dehydratase